MVVQNVLDVVQNGVPNRPSAYRVVGFKGNVSILGFLFQMSFERKPGRKWKILYKGYSKLRVGRVDFDSLIGQPGTKS